ncbi:Mitochondrial amidoxime reducing component 2-like protein [Drosera capensis]
MGEARARVKSIFIYPIKSCRGISLPQARISTTGFRWDRQWLIVNSNGRMYTQRVVPKLALVEVELPNGAFSEEWVSSATSYLVIRAPGMNALKVPLTRRGEKVDSVSVWNWSGSALDEGSEAAEWFSTYIGKPSRLVRFDADFVTRSTDPDYARGYRTMFSDHSILVDGCEPFSEDLWKEINVNKLTFYGVKLCARCKVPSISQETGIAGIEPTEALKTFRSDKVLLPHKKPQGQVYFGQNMVCKGSIDGGRGKGIRIGDPVYIIKRIGKKYHI